jgi:hypothetical protein
MKKTCEEADLAMRSRLDPPKEGTSAPERQRLMKIYQ